MFWYVFTQLYSWIGAPCTGSRYFHDAVQVSATTRSLRRDNEKDTFSATAALANHPSCTWSNLDQRCHPSHHINTIFSSADDIEYQSACPLEPAYPAESPDFLGDWMSALMKISTFSSTPLSALSIPGTHDSLSYDLSLTLAHDAVDDHDRLSKILRELSILRRPNEVEEFIRLQAQSQKLDIVQQLDNGIRFIDFRITYESKETGQSKADWYSLHSVLSTCPAAVYLKEVRDWMEEHPQEVVVVWFSRHGSVSDRGESAYPNTPISAKLQFWRIVEEIFDGVLIDTSVSDYRTTEIKELVARNHRLVPFVSDYEEFTDSSVHGYDSKCINNEDRGGIFHEVETYEEQREYFFSRHNVDEDKWFDLLGMNTAAEEWQIESALKLRFLPFHIFDSCSSAVNIPGNQMCPTSLLDIAQLQNYYNQRVLAEAYESYASGAVDEIHFPNAFYLDGLDVDGSVRTGTMTLEGRSRPGALKEYNQTRYAAVDTIIAYNVEKVCKSSLKMSDQASCQNLQTYLEGRISRYPAQRWQEPALGRRDDWPM